MSKTKLRKEYEARFGVVTKGFRLYNDKGNRIYYETPSGHWYKYEYDSEGNETYFEHCKGYWAKYEYDEEGNQIYSESSERGITLDKRSCSDKVFIEQKTGKKYKIVEI